jgi:hypothetical protein
MMLDFLTSVRDYLEIEDLSQDFFRLLAKHCNYYEYPETRYAVTVSDKNKVKFYELEFKSADIDNNAKEISQQEFERRYLS